MNIARLLTPKADLEYLYIDNTLRQGLEKMRAHSYTAIPVITREGAYAGSVSEGDFLWHILKQGEAGMKAQERFSISDILRRDWNPAVGISMPLQALVDQALRQNFVPVVDDRDVFIGIVTRKAIIKALLAETAADQPAVQMGDIPKNGEFHVDIGVSPGV